MHVYIYTYIHIYMDPFLSGDSAWFCNVHSHSRFLRDRRDGDYIYIYIHTRIHIYRHIYMYIYTYI